MHALLEKRADAADASVLFFKAGRANFLLLYTCVKHALNTWAGKLSTSTDPGICFVSTLQYIECF